MDDFEERHGWAPDCNYELIGMNKTPEEAERILYGKKTKLQNPLEGWKFDSRRGCNHQQ